MSTLYNVEIFPRSLKVGGAKKAKPLKLTNFCSVHAKSLARVCVFADNAPQAKARAREIVQSSRFWTHQNPFVDTYLIIATSRQPNHK